MFAKAISSISGHKNCNQVFGKAQCTKGVMLSRIKFQGLDLGGRSGWLKEQLNNHKAYFH